MIKFDTLLTLTIVFDPNMLLTMESISLILEISTFILDDKIVSEMRDLTLSCIKILCPFFCFSMVSIKRISAVKPPKNNKILVKIKKSNFYNYYN